MTTQPKFIRARAVAGRIARTDPNGPQIPWDKYVSVANTEYVQRLLTVHGDIELEPAPAAPKEGK